MTIDHRTIAQQWTEIILDTVLDDIEAIKRATPVVQDLIDSMEESLQIIKGVTYYVEYPVEKYEFDKMAGKVIVGSYENPIEILSKRDVEVFNATSKMIWGKVEKNITTLLKQTNNNTTKGNDE